MKKILSIIAVMAMAILFMSGFSSHGYALEKKTSAAVESEAGYCEDEHSFGEWIHTKFATADRSGEYKRVCQACGEEEFDEYEFTSIPYPVTGGFIYFNGETGMIESGEYNVEKVDIPEKIDGINVTGIEAYAFSGCESLVSVTFPNGIKDISEGAFSSCVSLKDITIPDGITGIGDNAFEDCRSIEIIKLPGTVKKIGDCSFYGCTELKRLEIPVSVTKIGDGAFYECSSLKNITIPDSVNYIGEASFAKCIKLENIEIPRSVVNIGSEAFGGCTSLVKVMVMGQIKWIDWSTFAGCSKLQYINIPDSVTNIGTSAFSGCSSLRNIEISENVKNVGAGAFAGCNVTIYGKKGSYIETYAKKNNILFIVKDVSGSIPPKVASQKKVSAYLYGYNDFKISWSSQKVSGATVRYKVEYREYGSKWNTLYKGTTAVSAKKANLADGTRYAFRVTPYATVKGKTYYGASESTQYIYFEKAEQAFGKEIIQESSEGVMEQYQW